MAELAAVCRPVPAAHDWAEPLFTFGVTGTNGKTSTTHLIAAIVQAAGHHALCQSTLGYFLDAAPLEVTVRDHEGFTGAMKRAADAGVRHAAIEVTSKALSKGYALAWRFDLGVFTNLSRDHLEEHGSWEGYLAAKAQLFIHLGPGRTAVLNACDEAAALIDRAVPPDVKRLWYGAPWRGERRHDADLFARSADVTLDGTTILLEPSELAERLGEVVRVRLVGDVFGENALAAAAAALAAGMPVEAIVRGLAACPPPPGRFELLSREPLVAIDYAHTPDALARVMQVARRVVGSGRVIVVFGAGGGYDPEKRAPMGEAVGAQADLAFVTNDNPRREDPAVIARAVAAGCARAGHAETRLIYDRADAIRAALSEARPGDLVLVTGRGHDRGMTFATGRVDYSDVDTLRAILDS